MATWRAASKRRRRSFECLHRIFAGSIFGIVKSKLREDGSVKLSWNLYGNSGNGKEIISLKSVKLAWNEDPVTGGRRV